MKDSNGSRVLTILKNCFPSFPFESNPDEWFDVVVVGITGLLLVVVVVLVVFGLILDNGGTTEDTIPELPADEFVAGGGKLDDVYELVTDRYSPELVVVSPAKPLKSSSCPEFSNASLNVC